jgi:hypothetical protein
VKAGVLPFLSKLLLNSKTNIVKEAAWTASNVCAGTLEQINEVINAGIVPLLINVLNKARYYFYFCFIFVHFFFNDQFIKQGDFRAQKEAAWAITNITSGGAIDHMIYLCQNGAVPAMCNMLSCRDWRTIITVMDGLENVLKVPLKNDYLKCY